MNATPIALFTYNRPEHTRRILRSLGRAARLGECILYIYSDGPRSVQQSVGVEATRQVIRQEAESLQAGCKGLEMRLVEREANLGLAGSITGGVSELCGQFGRVIVLEDDLVVSPDFLDYMLQTLERYQEQQNVYQVSGFMFPVRHPLGPDAFFLPLTTTWGWATWERAWKVYDGQARDAMQNLDDPGFARRFDLGGSYPYSQMLRDRLNGRNNSWGILWWYSVFQAGGLVLHPRQSLVWNGGFDNSGVHSGAPVETMQLAEQVFNKQRLSAPLHWPAQVEIDEQAWQRVKTYLGKVKGRRGLRRLAEGLLRRISRLKDISSREKNP